MEIPFDVIALTLVPCAIFVAIAVKFLCQFENENDRAWVSPCFVAIAIATLGTIQAFVLFRASPVDLHSYGAFYSPTALWAQSWRFVSSIFLYEDNLLVLFNVGVIAIAGTRLSQLIGARGFWLVFFVSSFAGTALIASYDAQALIVGASSAAFGVSAAAMARGGYRAQTTFERIARAVTFGYFAVAVARFLDLEDENADRVSIICALTGAVFGLLLRNALDIKRKAIRWGTVALCLISPFALALSTPATPDLLDIAAAARKSQDEVWKRLGALEKARSRGWMSDGEFAHRLNFDVVEPIDEIAKASASWDSRSTTWIRVERTRLQLRHSELSTLSELLLAKQALMDAEAAENETARVHRLDEFWKKTEMAFENVKAMPPSNTIRKGAESDLKSLSEIAVDLEIWNVEAAIAETRERLSSELPRKPAAAVNWGDEKASWVARRQRLLKLQPGTEGQSERLEALKTRLNAAADAIH